MKKLAAISAALVLASFAVTARAEDISASKMQIKDHATDPAKRQLQILSKDDGVQYSEADNPGTNGALVHVYNASHNFCVQIAGGSLWNDNGKSWKYVDPDTKNQLQISDGKLQVKIRSGVTLPIIGNTSPETFNAQVQFGTTGSRYCVHCTGEIKNVKWQAKECVAAACDTEPGGPCNPGGPTTTTSTTTTSTTTTMSTTTTTIGTILKAILPQTATGKFNYVLTPGVAGANAFCTQKNAGSHPCTYAELNAAQLAGDFAAGLKDVNGTPVGATGFWSVDATRPDSAQCVDAGAVRWNYATAHLATGGDHVSYDSSTKTLGAFVGGVAHDGTCFSGHWVGCCQ